MFTRSYHLMYMYSDMLVSYGISFSPQGKYLIFPSLVGGHKLCGKIMTSVTLIHKEHGYLAHSVISIIWKKSEIVVP